jgi:hypothetical protein
VRGALVRGLIWSGVVLLVLRFMVRDLIIRSMVKWFDHWDGPDFILTVGHAWQTLLPEYNVTTLAWQRTSITVHIGRLSDVTYDKALRLGWGAYR